MNKFVDVDSQIFNDIKKRIGELLDIEVWECGSRVYIFKNVVLLNVAHNKERIDYDGVKVLSGGLRVLSGVKTQMHKIYFDSFNRSMYITKIKFINRCKNN